MHEAGVPGPICRSQQFAPTANFAFVHMLTSDATPVSGDLFAFLSAVSGGHFAGGTNGLPSNFDVSMNGVSEVLGSDGAHLTVRGNLTINTGPAIWKFTFTHRFTMAIAPATDVNAAHVLALTTPTAGQLALVWNQTPPANGDNILKFVQGLIEPVMRPLVPTKIAALAQPDRADPARREVLPRAGLHVLGPRRCDHAGDDRQHGQGHRQRRARPAARVLQGRAAPLAAGRPRRPCDRFATVPWHRGVVASEGGSA